MGSRFLCGLMHQWYARAVPKLLKNAWGLGDLNMDMANVAKIVLFVSACASLFGLGLFLFRDQIFPQTGVDGGRS
jgi:hypothetical protein